MIVSPNMVTESEIICQHKSMTVKEMKYHLRVTAAAQERSLQKTELSSPPPPDAAAVVVGGEVLVADAISTDISRFESVVTCSDAIQDAVIDSSTAKFLPKIRSGSDVDKGPRASMEDEHIRIDDLSAHLGSDFKCLMPCAFYAVFDGHGGPEAAAYIKKNAMRLFFEDCDLPQTSEIDSVFLEELENSHRKAFVQADHALLTKEASVSSSCGTTALTALLLGRHLLVANAGDCRAVLGRKGVAVPMSQDHKPTYLPELQRVEEAGGFIMGGYLNGDLSVTRALGDWYLKNPMTRSPLIAEPDVQRVILTEDDEFLIIGCDGIWDVMSSQDAVSLVRRGLRTHDDPQQCAKELVQEALRLHTSDNLTVIVICFSTPSRVFDPSPRVFDPSPRQRPRFFLREARSRLKSLLEGN